MKNSKIEWCDHTVNFWWGCKEVSEACKNCYARAIAKRFKVDCWGDMPRHFRFEKAIEEARKLNASALRRGVVEMVFVNSMSDFFDTNVSDGIRLSLWRLFKECNNLIFMILTKRASFFRNHYRTYESDIPPNVHFGITAENQARLNERMKALKNFKGKLFLSVEPMLGELFIDDYRNKIDWVICGGEKCKQKEQARPIYALDVLNLRRQCMYFGIPFFFKQRGSHWIDGSYAPKEYDAKEYPIWALKGEVEVSE